MANKIIQSIQINTENIRASGETRPFTVLATKDAVFSLEIVNNHDRYYNFKTKRFSATRSRLNNIIVKNGNYKSSISFPALPDSNTDTYNIYLFADGHYDTEHVAYKEARFVDGSLDVNLSTGSDSLVLTKKLFQHADVNLTLSAFSPNAVTAFGSMTVTAPVITLTRGSSANKRKFKIVIVSAATRNFALKRQPEQNDFMAFVTPTIGAAAIPIAGEDVSASTYYKWPVDSVHNIAVGMFATGTNITANSVISDYYSTSEFTSLVETSYTKRATGETEIAQPTSRVSSSYGGYIQPSTQERRTLKTVSSKTLPREEITTTVYDVFEPGVQATGDPLVTNGVVTRQAGNIVFSLKQADALKSDTDVRLYGYGPGMINIASGYDVTFSNLKAELNLRTVTTTSSTIGSASTSVAVSGRGGIRDGLSTVSSINIDDSTALPTVSSGAGTVSGAGTIVLSAAQELESGETLTIGNTSKTVTVTGEIEIKKAGIENYTVRIDVEKFIDAA